MLRLLLFAVALLFVANSALAATLNYSYQGLSMGEEPAFTGTLSINEDLLPEGAEIANAGLFISNSLGGLRSYRIYNGFDVAKRYSIPEAETVFFETSGFVDKLLSTSVFRSFYFAFDANKQIVGWTGACQCEPGKFLFSDSLLGDGFLGGPVVAPGTWSFNAQADPPTHAPIPASALLLIGGLFSLGWLKQRVNLS